MKRLFVLGKILKSDSRAVAVVGARKMTPRGKRITTNFVKELVKANFTIVSGLARGIDTVAHETAIKNGGRTIAVLGSGIDIIYPLENKNLAEKITQKGAVVSAFPKGTKPFAKNFLARNRIIVGLAKAVLVIEGQRRSGTLSTASWAATDGKEVFAVPGSEATDWLIEQGANVANDPRDVIEYLDAINNS
ncbi:DNA protecting protein DprA [Candidatus Woesebacteria bacterium RIFCSPHIGHO2_12_FULL_46_16]|uniref:DNA protecting protein DprA n=1 Tax=Candidatus Woesebacteria bacterium RIFCSPHIGHO2_12_FULL_46_16 TaxID=1802513 RepID=A0A1F8B0C1_9BACT|nr:MAG: DNA protecting protein DprA [Candidatus Woesebacteria bacterium RIFCSPHIGHO2_12_FULL_46_16]